MRTAVWPLVERLLAPDRRSRRRARTGLVCTLLVAVMLAFPAAAARVADEPAALRMALTSVLESYEGTVAVEHYTQNGRHTLVELHADFSPSYDDGRWSGVRQVSSVNGRPVPDSRTKVIDILSSDMDNASVRRSLAAESARFNDRSVLRNVNNPAVFLGLVDPRPKWRVSFGEERPSTREGEPFRVFPFSEHTRPTFLRTATGADVPSSGAIWLTLSGELRRIDIEAPLLDPDGKRTSGKALVTIWFARDARLGDTVPVRMDERYLTTSGFAFLSCTAVYTDYRRFDVAVSEITESGAASEQLTPTR